MTAFAGKSGADAIAKAHDKICRVIRAYSGKLDTAISLTETAGLITSDQATLARTTLAGAQAACDVFEIIAKNSGFNQTGSV